jgi:cytochrome c oxidase subunit 1
MSMAKMPLTVWALLITQFSGCFHFLYCSVHAILLIFDRSIGTSFYLDDSLHQRPCLPNDGEMPFFTSTFSGSSVTLKCTSSFFQHSAWFRKCWPRTHGSRSSVIARWILSILAIAILAFVVWAHHMFVTGLNPFVASVFVFLTFWWQCLRQSKYLTG